MGEYRNRKGDIILHTTLIEESSFVTDFAWPSFFLTQAWVNSNSSKAKGLLFTSSYKVVTMSLTKAPMHEEITTTRRETKDPDPAFETLENYFPTS